MVLVGHSFDAATATAAIAADVDQSLAIKANRSCDKTVVIVVVALAIDQVSEEGGHDRARTVLDHLNGTPNATADLEGGGGLATTFVALLLKERDHLFDAERAGEVLRRQEGGGGAGSRSV